MKDLTQIFPSKIIRMVCDFMGITEDELEVECRLPKYVIARKLITYCLMYLNIPSHAIGILLMKNHATITHYKKGLLNKNDKHNEKLEEFKVYMGQHDIIIPGLIEWKGRVKKRRIKFDN